MIEVEAIRISKRGGSRVFVLEVDFGDGQGMKEVMPWSPMFPEADEHIIVGTQSLEEARQR